MVKTTNQSCAVRGSLARALFIPDTFYTSLHVSGTSRSGGTTVRVINASHALSLRDGTGRSRTRTFTIAKTCNRYVTYVFGTAMRSGKFGSFPVNEGTVAGDKALYAATLEGVAVGCTIIRTVGIRDTVVYANVGDRIAIGLVRNFTTINGTTLCARRKLCASIASSV